MVVPAFACGSTLPLTLASLAAQTYPSALLEVVVVDDGTTPALSLPEVRPERTRLVRAPSHGWGRAHACHTGAGEADGEILHWLDADMVVFPDHVAAQVRWHDTADHIVTMGTKRFVDPVPRTTQEAVDAVRAGRAESLYDRAQSAPHAWIEKILDETDCLRAAGPEAFRVHVGATASLTRDLYLAAGGMDTSLKLGEDSELGYRLAQAGAVFVPELAARSWHLGQPTVVTSGGAVARYNRPFVTDRMPLPRFRRRRDPGRLWSVPLVDVRVHVGHADYESVKATVDSALRSTVSDVSVHLVGPWTSVDDRRSPPLSDPQLELRLLRAEYAGEPRVHLTTQDAPSSFPAAFRLVLPVGTALAPGTIERLVTDADEASLSLLQVDRLDGVAREAVVRLERTSAVNRVRRVAPTRAPGSEEFDALLVRAGGERRYDGRELGAELGPVGGASAGAPGAPSAELTRWRRAARRARAEAERWEADARRAQEQASRTDAERQRWQEQAGRWRQEAQRGSAELERWMATAQRWEAEARAALRRADELSAAAPARRSVRDVARALQRRARALARR